MGSKKKAGIGIAVVVIIIVVVLLVIYVIPLPPHFGYVSESQVNSATGSKFTSTSNNTNFTGLSGAKSTGYEQYGSGTDFVLIAVAEYNTSSEASLQFGNLTASISAVSSFSGLEYHNVTVKGFTVFYGSASVLTVSVIFAIGRDSNYLFAIVGELPSGSSTVALTLAKDQVSTMTSI